MSQTLQASAAKTASYNTPNISTFPYKGGVIVVDVTAVSGTTPSMVVNVQRYDGVSGKFVTVLSSVAITAAGTTSLVVFPGAAVTANQSANTILGDEFRVSVAITGTNPSFTHTIGFDGVK